MDAQTSWVRGAPPANLSEDPQPAADGRGRPAVPLIEPYTSVLDRYGAALRLAAVSDQTRRTYASKVRQFLAWLAQTDLDGDPLTTKDARDQAVHVYRTHLQAGLDRKPATINGALAAIDDFYIRHGLGPAPVARVDLPKTTPTALTKQEAIRFLRAVEATPSPRDQALALVPFYAGTRIAEVVGLNVNDVDRQARNAILRVDRKAGKAREIPIHPRLLAALTDWLNERSDWPEADSPPLFLNQQGKRLTARGAHAIITAITQRADLPDGTTARVLRHTFATRLAHGGANLVTVADLLGHAHLDTTRVYAQPTPDAAVKALQLLDIIDDPALLPLIPVSG